jgi:hypothetical protein
MTHSVVRQRSRSVATLALLLVAGCAVTGPVDEPVSRVSVTFVEPEKFTDARRAELDPASSGNSTRVGKVPH